MGKNTFELGGQEWPRVTWYKMKGMRSVYMMLWAALITSATNGYDGSLMNGLEAMKAWKRKEDLTIGLAYGHPTGASLGLLVSIMYLGGVIAIPIVPYIADLLGRRTGIVIGCCIMLSGVAMVSIGFHIAIFIVGRFMLGFGLGIAQACSPLLLSELVHPQHRAPYTTVYNALWYVGAVIGSCVALGANTIHGNWSWRTLCLLQAIPSLSQLFFIWFIPESPRWLISKGKDQKAKQILAYVHAEGNEDDPFVNVEFTEIRQTLMLEKEFEKASWSELWRTKGMRHRLVILISIGMFSQLSGNGLFSYYLPRVLNLIGITTSMAQLRMNMYLQVVNVISAVGICFFVDKIGRRPLFRTSIIGMATCFVSMTIALARYSISASSGVTNTPAAHAFLVFMFAFYVFYNLAFSGMLVSYPTEILPYRVRAKGLNVMFLCVDLSLFFNSYVNPIALGDIHWKYYLVYCCWFLVEIFVVFKFYIETKNTPLEEIVRYFDGDSAIIGGEKSTTEDVRTEDVKGNHQLEM